MTRVPLPAWQLWLWPLLLAALAGLIWLLPWQDWVAPLRLWVEGYGSWGWLVYVLIYAVVVMLPLPAAVMSVVGGLIFGWWGFVLAMIGSVLGAWPPWWATQRWLRQRVLRRFEGPKVLAADRAISENAFVFVALLRITPILPYTMQNYLLGLTAVRFWPYTFATLIGLAPGTLGMVWIGELGGLSALGLEDDKLLLAAGGLLIFGAFMLWLIRYANAELRRAGFYDETEVPPDGP